MTISKLSTSASLKQVMDKFEEISIQDFSKSNIDVITAKTLPSVVKEGQIVVITDKTPGKIIVDSSKTTSAISDNDIVIYHNTEGSTVNKFSVKGNNKEFNSYVSTAMQKTSGALKAKSAYIGVNGSWNQFSYETLYVWQPSIDTLPDFGIKSSWLYDSNAGNPKNFSYTVSGSSEVFQIYATQANGYSSNDGAVIYYKTPIDVTPYTKLKVKLAGTMSSGGTYYEKLTFGLVKGEPKFNGLTFAVSAIPSYTTFSEFTLDVTKLTGSYYIAFYSYDLGNAQTVTQMKDCVMS